MSNYRNPKILALAREHSCQLCGADDSTIVAAHSNQGKHGKGMSIKAHDYFVIFCCSRCHSFIDTGSASKESRVAAWEAAYEKTFPLFRHLLDAEALEDQWSKH